LQVHLSQPGIDEEERVNRELSTHHGGNLIGDKNMLAAELDGFVSPDKSGSSS